MRILVTGRDGQVTKSLQEKLSLQSGIKLIVVGRPEFDLAQPTTVYNAIINAQPDLVVSAAAYTAVDQAEDEPELAYAINAAGAEAVAAAAHKCGVPVIHLSTDYIFSGDSRNPYTEEDLPEPRSVYGHTKLEGERLVALANPQHVILRTSWVYSPFGKNFVKTLLALAPQRESISIVADQWGNPTSAIDLASAILHIADHVTSKSDPAFYGVYHLAGTGDINWSGFTRAIFEISQMNGGPSATVIDISSADYPTKAIRPRNSRLNCRKYETTFGSCMPHWRTSVGLIIEGILRNKS
ncbi:dTDP-4-dehydrorhamnose reductase [Pseudochrobactrum lubricantis]|uniref:dTDP-4-dehydrorhamnose reductase n=1 Tax=Pseudochrobactrum lubricantis TaxID=558172 RepID=UPI0035D7D82C